MAIVKKNHLPRFLNKVKKFSRDAQQTFAGSIAETGKEIAEKLYGITPDKDSAVTVSTQELGKGKARIIASGKGLIYQEYGTGVQGEKSNYEGNLNFPIDFVSSYTKNGERVHVHLNKWTYYYAHQLKLSPKKFEGHEAYAQMFNTGQELKKLYGSKRR